MGGEFPSHLTFPKMNTETLSNIFRLLTKYPKFKDSEGLPRIENSEYSKCMINLLKARRLRPELNEALKYFKAYKNKNLVAFSWTQEKECWLLFSDSTEEIHVVNLDLEVISGYLNKPKATTQKALIELARELQNIIILTFFEPFDIGLADIRGFKLPVYKMFKGLRLDFGDRDHQAYAGYNQEWISEDNNLDEILMLCQHEVLQEYIHI